jgi:2-keto-myo-inositol isomerase
MIDKSRFALNRIVSPSMSLSDFFDLTVSLGMKKVELRNDIGKADPIDGLKAAEVARMATDKGIEVISINALQKFNLPEARAKATGELKELLELSKGIGCRAVVLCPNNEASDKRSAAQRAADTAEALAAYAPLFVKAGILGYVEPLGFAISSLASLAVAAEAIRKSGQSCYRVLIDSFHHHIGPDTAADLGSKYPIDMTGLVHISGVEADIAIGDYRDEHRVLVGPGDRMKSKEQIRMLEKLGYAGDYSFEPFSPAVQKLARRDLAAALKTSIDYLVS